MRISAKARYGLASAICLAQSYNTGEYITVISLSEKLKISKIYLEQVFALLKRANVVVSTKGKQGGYQLADTPRKITVFDVLSAIEVSLFEKTPNTVLNSSKFIEKTMKIMIFERLDETIKKQLSDVKLEDLVAEAEKQSSQDGYMFYL
jgi:Rrf2 family protein